MTVYLKKYLVVKLLIENISKQELKGIYRPQAYIKDDTSYCTECQMELIPKGINPGEDVVINAALFAPHGFGENLRQGTLLNLQNGLDVEARAVVLEIIGYRN